MKSFKIKATDRKVFGRKVKSLRKEGFIPSNVYGKKVESKSIQIDAKEFENVFKEAGETSIVEILLGKEVRPCLINNVQKDPVSDSILHVDFHQVDLKEKVKAEVPIEMVGESPAEKQGLGTLVQYLDEIEVEALPTDLPEKFEVDVANLTEVDQAILVSDLKVDSSKVLIELGSDTIVAKIEALRAEEEEAPAPTEEGEADAGVEGASEAKTEGGEKGEEGKEKPESKEEHPKEKKEE